MKHRVLWVLILGAGAIGWGQVVPGAENPGIGIPFELNQSFGLILLRAQVNGQPVTLVVDTGASHTILSSDVLRVRPLALQRADPPSAGSGYVGSAGWAKATVEIGAMKWADRRVLVMNDFQDLSRSVNQKVDGILGQDVLKEFDFVALDFKHRRLVLSH